jgi:hypothetical protein
MPTYLHNATIEDVARMVESLTEELWILKDRTLVLEQLLIDKAGLSLDEIETYEPGPELTQRLARERQRVIRKVLGAPLATGVSHQVGR